MQKLSTWSKIGYGVCALANTALMPEIAQAAGQPTVTVLHSLTNAEGAYSNLATDLIQAANGYFYGTTCLGGDFGGGTVFRVSPTGAVKVLHSFGSGTDGKCSEAALVQGTDGNFYGTTNFGGTYGVGVVFKITPGGVETVLYSFLPGQPNTYPWWTNSALIQGFDGNLYGAFGGFINLNTGQIADYGSLYKITPTGNYTLLHSFSGGTDGGLPLVALAQGADGNFFGTTLLGGLYGFGTIFMITPNGIETVLHTFTGQTDGAEPNAALVQGSDGNFYGSTTESLYGGVLSDSHGNIFKITTDGIFTLLHTFNGTSDGTYSTASLVQRSKDGNFYGTTHHGGDNGVGTIFEITPTGTFTALYSFPSGTASPVNPSGLVEKGTSGTLYGTSRGFGTSYDGTIYKITFPWNW